MAEAEPSKATSLRTRVLSAAAGAPLLIAFILWPGGAPFSGWPFALLVLALTLVALREFYDGCRGAGLTPRDLFGFAAALLILLINTPLVREHDRFLVLSFGLTVLAMASLATEALRPGRAPLKSLAPTWLGIAYVGWLFPFTLRLRLASAMAMQHLQWLPGGWMGRLEAGAWLVLFTLVVTSSVDTGAYFVGKSIGRHKLAPAVSPGKTWEGAVGGFIAALLVGAALGAWLRLPVAFAMSAAALIGILSQLGDLSKSAIKREIGIKDFGTLIPGHGGVLDRFDSLIFAAPAVYWLLALWEQ
jgi:phosphatidate cytidylyltransferase